MNKSPKTRKKTTKTNSNFKKYGLRHPSNLPATQQWKMEGDAELMKRLTKEEQIWLAAFCEAEFGGNMHLMYDDKEKAKAIDVERKRNDRDPLSITRRRDRVTLEKAECGLPRRDNDTVAPTVIQKREKVSIDSIQRDTATNSVEDSVIALIDGEHDLLPLQKSVKRRRAKSQ